jgi:hypothetical protein
MYFGMKDILLTVLVDLSKQKFIKDKYEMCTQKMCNQYLGKGIKSLQIALISPNMGSLKRLNKETTFFHV